MIQIAFFKKNIRDENAIICNFKFLIKRWVPGYDLHTMQVLTNQFWLIFVGNGTVDSPGKSFSFILVPQGQILFPASILGKARNILDSLHNW